VCVVRVLGQTINGTRQDSVGSGVLVSADPPVVLTAWHVLSDQLQRPVSVTFPATGKSYWVSAYNKEPDADMVALHLADKPTVNPAVLADTDPAPGEEITLVGYAHGQTFRATAGRVTHRMNDYRIEVTPMPVEGDSGGPAYDATGAVCGVIVGVSPNTGVVSSSRRCGVLHRLLQRALHPFGGKLRPGTTQPRQAVPPSRQQTAPVTRPPVTQSPAAAATRPVVPREEPTPANPPTRPATTAPATTAPSTAAPVNKPARPGHSVLVGAANALPTPGIGWWTAIAGLLGVGGPVGLGIGVAGWLISRRLKQRIVDRVSDGPSDPVPQQSTSGGKPRYREYAKSLASKYANNGGRDLLWDQHLGRIYDAETKELAASAEDDTLRRVLQDLRERVERNVSRIFTKGADRTYTLN